MAEDSSGTEIKEVALAVVSLKLNVNESHPTSLIGDDFDRSWTIEDLTLPNLTAPVLLAEITHQDAIDLSDSGSALSLYQNLPFALTKVLSATMVSLDRLTSGESKVVYEACLHLSQGERFDYQPGDSIGILCENSHQDVNWLLEHIDFGSLSDPDTGFVVKPVSDKTRNLPGWFVPQITVTARILLTYCCEIHIPVTRRITRLCAHFCSSELERIRLLELSSRQGHQMFDKLIREPNITLLDLFASFPSIRLPLMRLLELLPRLQPRAYSLISLPNSSPASQQSEQELRFMFTRVDFSQSSDSSQPVGLRRYAGRIHGTCTGWLERLWNDSSTHSAPGKRKSEIRIYLRNNMNNFRMPDDPNQPVIMIGAGTGLAPFLSFIKFRESLVKSSIASTYGPLWLIYGCRSSKTSLLYKQYLLKAFEDKILHHLCLCFSRDSVSTDDKGDATSPLLRACLPPNARYVQDCLTLGLGDSSSDHAKQLVDLILNHNAKIMVCGEARNFAPSVQEACSRLIAWGLKNQDSLGTQLSNTELERGSSFVKQMQTEKRYIVDIWI